MLKTVHLTTWLYVIYFYYLLNNTLNNCIYFVLRVEYVNALTMNLSCKFMAQKQLAY